MTEANTELAEANVLKGAFIEVASHEFNTPITLVLGLSELLKLLNPGREPREREVVDRIAGSARQLGKLVANTLTLMRAEDFRHTLRREPVDLAALLRDVAGGSSRSWRRAEPPIRPSTWPTTSGVFELDPAKIGDAVLNLLTNAIKFTPDGGEISLVGSARSRPTRPRLSWPTGGSGSSLGRSGRCSSPFSPSSTPAGTPRATSDFQKRGLGLGLSIVRQFVELHGGTVSAESARSAKGRGSALRLLASPLTPIRFR